jgi:hypothetical protein
VGVCRHTRGHVNGRCNRGVLENVDLPVLTFTHGPMLEAHVVSKDVNSPSLLRGDCAGEDNNFTVGIVLEKHQLGIKAQSLRVVQIHVS